MPWERVTVVANVWRAAWKVTGRWIPACGRIRRRQMLHQPLLGSGKIFNIPIYNENYGTLIFVLAPGAFIALGYLIALVNRIRKTN